MIMRSKKEKLFSFFKEKFADNKSIFYYIVSFVFVFGLLFFISSSSIFDSNNKKIRSTPLNEIQQSESLQAKMLKRTYDPSNKMVEFIVYIKDDQNFDNKEVIFQLREQSKPDETIDTRYNQVAENYYIVFAEVPKKWNVLSLSMGYKSDLVTADDYVDIDSVDDVDNISQGQNNKNTELSTVVRIYSDINAIDINKNLKEKSTKDYLSEITSIETEFIEKKKEQLTHKIAKNLEIIEDAEMKINDLKSNQKYQTESEEKETENNISSLKSLISSKESQNDSYYKQHDELNQKIKILEQKQVDFAN